MRSSGSDLTPAAWKLLDDGGIRGIRFSLTDPKDASTSFEMIEPLSRRVTELGWHVQINMTADQVVSAADLWNRLPSPIVFDHLGRTPHPQHASFTVISRLIEKGRTWVKLSVTYDNSKDGPPGYEDLTRVAQAFVRLAPERLLWGSNWPHPHETKKPDDALLFDLIAEWAPDVKTRERILVENPAALYRFPTA